MASSQKPVFIAFLSPIPLAPNAFCCGLEFHTPSRLPLSPRQNSYGRDPMGIEASLSRGEPERVHPER